MYHPILRLIGIIITQQSTAINDRLRCFPPTALYLYAVVLLMSQSLANGRCSSGLMSIRAVTRPTARLSTSLPATPPCSRPPRCSRTRPTEKSIYSRSSVYAGGRDSPCIAWNTSASYAPLYGKPLTALYKRVNKFFTEKLALSLDEC